jgi:hypothetical protein
MRCESELVAGEADGVRSRAEQPAPFGKGPSAAILEDSTELRGDDQGEVGPPSEVAEVKFSGIGLDRVHLERRQICGEGTHQSFLDQGNGLHSWAKREVGEDGAEHGESLRAQGVGAGLAGQRATTEVLVDEERHGHAQEERERSEGIVAAREGGKRSMRVIPARVTSGKVASLIDTNSYREESCNHLRQFATVASSKSLSDRCRRL